MKKNNSGLETILNIGVFLVFISGFFLVNSTWASFSNICKVVLVGATGIGFLGLSLFTSENMKLEKTGKIYWILGLAFLVFTWYTIGKLEIIGHSFSLSGTGKYLFISTIFMISSIFTYLSCQKFKNKNILYLYYFFLTCIVMSILLQFKFNYLFVTAVTELVLFIIYIARTEVRTNNFCKYMTLLLVLSNVFSTSADYRFMVLANGGVSLIILGYYLFKNKDELFGVLMPLITIPLLIVMCSIGIGNYDNDLKLMFIAACISIFEMIAVIVDNKSKSFKPVTIILSNLCMLLVLLFSLGVANIPTAFIVGLFYLITSYVVTTYFDKEKIKIENYILPFKTGLFLLIALSFINDSLISLSYVEELIIFSLVVVFFNYIIKDKFRKNIYLIAEIALMVIAIISINEISPLEFVLSLGLLGIEYISIYENKKVLPLVKKLLYICLLLFCAFTNVVAFNLSLGYMFSAIFLLACLYANVDKKFEFNTTIVALVYIIGSFLVLIIKNPELSIIVDVVSLLACMLLINHNVIKKSSNKDFLATIIIIICELQLFGNGGHILIMFAGLIAAAGIIYELYHKSYTGVRITSIISLAIAVLVLFSSYFGNASIWLYVFVVGLVIITVISRIIMNDDKKVVDYREKVNVPHNNFCGSCGTRLKGNEVFCGNCGKQLKTTINYCGNCGNKLKGYTRYCPICGNKTNK